MNIYSKDTLRAQSLFSLQSRRFREELIAAEEITEKMEPGALLRYMAEEQETTVTDRHKGGSNQR